MKLFQPTERVNLTWWQRVIGALVFVVVVFVGSTTARILCDHRSVVADMHVGLWPPGLVIWFVTGLFAAPNMVRWRVKP